MKVNYQELMSKLGVGRPLNPYETQPWLHYDEETNLTCEGEVRCNSDQSEIEAEIQFMHGTPIADKPPVEQICLLHVQKQARLNGDYTVVQMWIRGETWVNRFHDWEGKSCNFFRACIREIKAGRVPDIDDILSKEMKESGFYGSNQGDGSNKSPKINTANLLYDMKNKGGHGF
jgi:hypothetical protein